jgi:hypothetical protein
MEVSNITFHKKKKKKHLVVAKFIHVDKWSDRCDEASKWVLRLCECT